MSIDYSRHSGLAFPKSSRVVEKIKREREDDAKERKVNAQVRARDKGQCRFPGCRARAQHKHHVIFRSQLGETSTKNLCSVCAKHHQQLHHRLIAVDGSADLTKAGRSQLSWSLTRLGVEAGLKLPAA